MNSTDENLSHFWPRDPDLFFSELEALSKQVHADRRPEDLKHLRRIERWGIVSSLIGYGTAWLGVNPISVIAMALGIACRWTMAHHILHRGYDSYGEARERERSTGFGRGLLRWLHWCDWMPIRAWVHEHNGLHHFRLGEDFDGDVPEVNFEWLAKSRLPMAAKYAVVFLASITWKWTYYGPRVTQVLNRQKNTPPGPYFPFAPTTWSPLNAVGRRVWRESWLPYVSVRFGLIPLLFLPLGRAAWIAVLLNTLFAELLTNFHSFLLVVPNHAGSDVPRFETPPQNKNEFRLRQIVGSVNFKTGGDVNDFLHGWLNYQIEHHVWPDLSMRQYQTWQPHLRALCERHGVSYIQDSVWERTRRLVHNVVGKSRMPVVVSFPTGVTALSEA